MEEQELLQRARGGDQAAFGLLMEQYERQVYRQALGLVDGGDNGAFGADTPATRVQAAALLWKYMSK